MAVFSARDLYNFASGWGHHPLEHGLTIIIQHLGNNVDRALISIEGHSHVVERFAQRRLVDIAVGPQLLHPDGILQVI